MKELSARTKLIMWDSAFVICSALWFLLHKSQPLIGFVLMIAYMSSVRNSVKNHTAVYKLTGKIY